MFSSSSHVRILLLSIIAASMAWLPEASADCFFESPTAEENFAESPIIVRLQYLVFPDSNGLLSLPCSLEIASDYLLEKDGFSGYKIMEVLKQNWTGIVEGDYENDMPLSLLSPGMVIPVIHETDTGFYKTLPSSLIDDEVGFLAFLTPFRYCFVGDEEGTELLDEAAITEAAYGGDDGDYETYRTNPFLLNECNIANQAWGDLSLEDLDFLQSLAPRIHNNSSDNSGAFKEDEELGGGDMGDEETEDSMTEELETITKESPTTDEPTKELDPTENEVNALEGTLSVSPAVAWRHQGNGLLFLVGAFTSAFFLLLFGE